MLMRQKKGCFFHKILLDFFLNLNNFFVHSNCNKTVYFKANSPQACPPQNRPKHISPKKLAFLPHLLRTKREISISTPPQTLLRPPF